MDEYELDFDQSINLKSLIPDARDPLFARSARRNKRISQRLLRGYYFPKRTVDAIFDCAYPMVRTVGPAVHARSSTNVAWHERQPYGKTRQPLITKPATARSILLIRSMIPLKTNRLSRVQKGFNKERLRRTGSRIARAGLNNIYSLTPAFNYHCSLIRLSSLTAVS